MSRFVKTVLTKNAPLPVAPYSQAIKAAGLVYCSGQIPLTPANKLIADLHDVKAQTTQCLTNLKHVIEASGSEWDKIIKVGVFLSDMKHFKSVNEVYAEWFKDHKPARTCVAVSELPMKVDVEIEAVALE